VARLSNEHPELKLRIVGDGSERASLQTRADELGIGERVEFLGTLSGDRLAREYRAADLLVMPSLREGFGVVLVEALACGTPVVATRSGGPADIVDGDKLGELVEPGDADALARGIRLALDRVGDFDPAFLARTARERYSHEAVGSRLVTLYQEVSAGESPTGTIAQGATR
jgi:glycosyltransferase involved in cell wall biosynthesis